jgi:hypothetical protein
MKLLEEEGCADTLSPTVSELAPGRRENIRTRETPQKPDAYDQMVRFAGDVEIPRHKEHPP